MAGLPEELSTTLDRTAADNDFTGVVDVRRHDVVFYGLARGQADRAHRIPVAADTRFAMASGSKGFTALAVMSLVVDGRLALDTPIRSILGDVLPQIDRGVTVGQLLGHTSGIGDYVDESADTDIDDYVLPVPVHRLATTPDYLAVLEGHPARSAPGERFEYCNSGYVVLALLVEAVTGTPFHDVVTDRVLRPAGMVETGYPRSDELPEAAAIGYVRVGGTYRTNVLHLPVRGSGDGGAFTTVADMARFWTSLFAGAVLPRTFVDDMTRPRSDVPAQSLRYGLGFWLRADRDTVMLEGYDAGVSFRSAYDPESGLLYTVASSTSAGAWPLVHVLDEAWPRLAST